MEFGVVLGLVENKLHTVDDEIYLVVDLMSGLQALCGRHPSFILRKSVQSTQRVLDVRLPNEPLNVFP